MNTAADLRERIGQLMDAPLSDMELDGVIDRSMDLIMYGATSMDRACGEQLIRMASEIAKARDALKTARER